MKAKRAGTMPRTFVAALMIGMVWSTGVARAGIVTYDFLGRVNLVFGNRFNGVSPSLGDVVAGSFSYDTSVVGTTVPNHPGALSYAEARPSFFSITLDGGTFRSVNSYDVRIENNNPYDAITLEDDSPLMNGAPPIPGYSSIYFQLVDGTASVFADRSLPAALDLANFNGQFCEITTVSGGVFSGVTFTVDSLTTVPEPGAPSLLVTAMVLSCLGFVKRRKKEGLNYGAVAKP